MIHDTDLITIEREKLARLNDNLLRVRDFIQDLEHYMVLLDLSLEGLNADNIIFLQFLINLVTHEFPPNDCREFKGSIDSTRRLIWDCLKIQPEAGIEE